MAKKGKKKAKAKSVKAKVKKISKAKKPAKKLKLAKNVKVIKAAKGGVGYWKIIADALKFSFSFDKVALVYLIMVPALALLAWFGYNMINLGNNLAKLSGGTIPPAVIGAIVGPLVLLIGYVIIQLFLQTLVRVGIIQNASSYAAGKKEPIISSIKAARSRYWPALGAIILLAIALSVITGILGVIPIIGSILSNLASIVFALMFLLFLPILVITGCGVIESYKQSFDIFIKRPGEVILMALAIGITELVIFLITMLIFLPFSWPALSQIVNLSLGATPDVFAILTALKANFAMLTLGAFVVAIVWAYLAVFADSVKTLFYLRIRKL